MEIKSKICSKCSKNKPLKDYYLYNTRGYFNAKCKKCVLEESRINIRKNRKIKGTYAWRSRRRDSILWSAKKRGISFDLSLVEFEKLKSIITCFYCGKEANNLTIDRVDNSKGYTIQNCVRCCRKCNARKGSMNLEDFEIFGKKIKQFLGAS